MRTASVLVARFAWYLVIDASRSRKKSLIGIELETKLLAFDASGIATAAELLNSGDLVAIPTETVYGLAADARSDAAVQKIYEAKKRPAANPLIIHLAKSSDLPKFALASELAMRLASRFWPGPLTLVLPAKANSGISALTTAGHPTLALRVPAHRAALEILSAFGGPAAAPSANISGRVSSTEASHVMEDLSGRIDAVVDGGPVRGRNRVDNTSRSRVILCSCFGPARYRPKTSKLNSAKKSCHARSHRPAFARSRVFALRSRICVRINADRPRNGEIWLGFGPRANSAHMNLSERGDLSEAASNLFQMLRIIDKFAIERGAVAIAVSRIPDYGIGCAINDRLRRAAEDSAN